MKETPYLQASEQLLQQFRSMPFFSSFADEQLTDIINTSKIQSFQPGETIIQEGGTDRLIYVLISGEVTVSRLNHGLCHLKTTGEVFGEMSIVSSEKRAATVQALILTSCLVFDVSHVNSSEHEQQAVFLAVMFRLLADTLAGRLRQANGELIRLQKEAAMLR
jgi:CRP/FNR family transcriptional regulator, cyclic AMP receptor protein